MEMSQFYYHSRICLITADVVTQHGGSLLFVAQSSSEVLASISSHKSIVLYMIVLLCTIVLPCNINKLILIWLGREFFA